MYAVTGNPKEPLHSYQRVNIQKTCTDTTFLLSAWAKAASAADTVQSFDWAYGSDVDNDHTKRYFGLVAESWYTGSSGTMYCEYYYMPFSDNYDDWQFASCVIVPGRYFQNNAMTLNYIDVYVVYDNNFSTMYVDNVSLRQEPCATYTYDGNGSITSVNATGTSSESVEYVGNTAKPSLVRTAGSGVYEYLYADPSTDYQPEYIVNYETEVYTNYLYDKYGNTTKTQIGSANALSAPKLITESTYSSDGSQLKSEINANGQTTSYEYGANRQVTKTTDSKGTFVVTEYAANDRITNSNLSNCFAVTIPSGWCSAQRIWNINDCRGQSYNNLLGSHETHCTGHELSAATRRSLPQHPRWVLRLLVGFTDVGADWR